ncbi:glycosyltransferase family 9 protein [Bacteroides ihuae]|uniref:glycosyltransferase family 9 protein n=1 Tax=Bacteroides ihuae TaxID=1852362 RepID=UPI0008DA2705|nr:glycosyltransferase family 9 protein [Bacteroides ihuae]
MPLLKSVNNVKRFILGNLTKKIGNSGKICLLTLLDKEDVKKVLIIRPNHRLGNQLLATPIVQDVIDTFPNCKIDLLAKGSIASIVFYNHKNIEKIISLPRKPFNKLFQYCLCWINVRNQHYDMVINVVSGSSSGRLLTKLSNAKYKIYSDDENGFLIKDADNQHIAKSPVCCFRSYLEKGGISFVGKVIPSLDLHLSAEEIARGKELLNELIKDKEQKTICLFTFATGEKCYSSKWWEEFHQCLKSKYTHFNIIEVLPMENVSQIAFSEPSFYSKDIREIGAVIANTAIFIGADSGIMHLASSVKTPTIGLFSITKVIKYTPYNNNSKGLNTNELSIDELLSEIDKIIICCHKDSNVNCSNV